MNRADDVLQAVYALLSAMDARELGRRKGERLVIEIPLHFWAKLYADIRRDIGTAETLPYKDSGAIGLNNEFQFYGVTFRGV